MSVTFASLPACLTGPCRSSSRTSVFRGLAWRVDRLKPNRQGALLTDMRRKGLSPTAKRGRLAGTWAPAACLCGGRCAVSWRSASPFGLTAASSCPLLTPCFISSAFLPRRSPLPRLFFLASLSLCSFQLLQPIISAILPPPSAAAAPIVTIRSFQLSPSQNLNRTHCLPARHP